MRMSVMGGRKPCVLKKKGAIIQSLVPPYGFGVWNHSCWFVTEKDAYKGCAVR